MQSAASYSVLIVARRIGQSNILSICLDWLAIQFAVDFHCEKQNKWRIVVSTQRCWVWKMKKAQIPENRIRRNTTGPAL